MHDHTISDQTDKPRRHTHTRAQTHPISHISPCNSYPFTAPEVNPATIRRWKTRTKTIIGTVIAIAPAAIDPVGSSNCELPVKFAIATGAVIAALVAVNDKASSRSFQAKMNTRIAAVTIPGAASGAITFRNA